MEVFRKIIGSGVMAEEGREKFARHIVSLPEPGKSQAIEEVKKHGLVRVLEKIKKIENEKGVKAAECSDNMPVRIT
jgi:vacuolar-type H+-ATPase catalytic subunit A/Vma1